MDETERFDGILYAVTPRIAQALSRMPAGIRARTQEVRLRAGLPVALTVDGNPVFLFPDGSPADYLSHSLLTADAEDLRDSFRLLCRSSVYAHLSEIGNGYVTMKNGHRAGICGTLTAEGTMRDVTSINLRIAREIRGCADAIVQRYTDGGVLIAGPPGSGKTTVLRDLIRQISDRGGADGRRIVVIDSRGELSGAANGEHGIYLGRNTDLLFTEDRAHGMQMALRTMFPQIIAFDEIGTAKELSGVREGLHAGVSVFTTAHVGGKDDLRRRSVTAGLLRTGAIGLVVLLSRTTGFVPEIIPAQELFRERND